MASRTSRMAWFRSSPAAAIRQATKTVLAQSHPRIYRRFVRSTRPVVPSVLVREAHGRSTSTTSRCSLTAAGSSGSPAAITAIMTSPADSIGRRNNTRLRGVAMSRKRRRADRAGRARMYSPGRPPGWRREHRQRFWAAIARGASSEDAAIEAGVSVAVGVRWFREGGGMPSITQAPLSGRYLSFAEREEIAILHARGCGVREIARQVGRSPSTISRELRRNAATRSGGLEYRASTAQWHADRRARRPSPPSWP